MADDTQSADTNSAPAIDSLENKLAVVKDEIANTPKEEQDTQWRNSVTSALTSISTALENLSKKPAGNSPEVAALEQKVDKILEAINKPVSGLPPTPSPSPPKRDVDGNPGPATPKEISSAPQSRKREEQPKRKREWL